MRVMVTGGAGYIGSIITEVLLGAGHEVLVYDNLQKGHAAAVAEDARFIRADLADGDAIRAALSDHSIEAVVHMAADSLVGESVVNPEKYYWNNMVAGLSLLEAMLYCQVKRLVFSSTAAVYGEPGNQPICESDPVCPTNPYGETKLAFERALRWYENAYGLRYVSLRYFNAAGATDRCGESHEPETHLIPLVLQTAQGKRQAVEIFGDDYPTRDGTCVRDYVHVLDLARAHVLSLTILEDRSAVYNLGCGRSGYTVRQVIEAACAVTGVRIPVKVGPRRPGDPAVLIASSEKIGKELGWCPQLQDLRMIIESAWRWMAAHPNGYPEIR